ncbi:Sodium/hydrogen exchanger 1 [Gossypium arboreum]|uniref:Sodium/hydrogen exchanger 1 n=1 Tax=Gossypium arboreum TaxID=29729 RepID=A0A0B0PGK3_GOSAR|nr:Sodium/hydrogen exchanger 1 [Gossypium arboreum]
MLPINYESWHQMPDSNKNQALDNIKERFALEVSDTYVKKALGKKLRDHKSNLKKEYFKKNISLEEKLRNVPSGMLRYQWEDTVRFWNSKKEEGCKRVGTSSKEKQKFTHTAGSKSFAYERSSSQKFGRLQLFDITHMKKNRSPMTSEAEEIMEKLKDKKVKYEAITSSDSSVNLENIDNRIITERLRDQIAQMQASTIEQIAQLRAEAAAREVEQSRKYDELQLQLQNMMTMFQQSQNPPS